MPEIRVLPDLLVNKIAAGEVIERPASVVKELLENAIDAGGRHIEAAIEDGGKRLIRVTDDGVGMRPDQLELAVAPHATSKLATEDDLYRIGTLGFRGEALASIGAISHLRIVSRVADSDAGAEIHVAAERIERSSAAGCPPGTTIEVRDLFFNVPARRKFLRTTSTESGHVNEQFARIALAYPPIGFELSSGKRLSHRLAPDQSRLERIAALFGAEIAADLITVRREERGLEIEAYAAPPARSRSGLTGQYVFVNGRYVRDRVLNYAIREAYRGLIEPDRYPVIFLFLSVDPAAVDVNVHPTKIEVRWQDSGLVRSQVLSAVRETLLRSDLTPALRTDRFTGTVDPGRQEDIRRRVAEEFKGAISAARTNLPGLRPAGHPAGQPGRSAGPGALSAAGAPPTPPDPGERGGADALWRSLYEPPASEAAAPADAAPGEAGPAPVQPAAPSPPAGPAHRRPAIQLHNTYLVTETDDGLVIIDQHALHERVIYEQLHSRLTSGPLEAQRLLLPETVEATPQQIATLQAQQELLHRLGIEVTPFGSNAVAIHAFPALLGELDARAFVRDLIDRLEDQAGNARTEEFTHELLDMMACKAAVKAGDALTPDEIDSLIASRDLVERSSNCPHGRPTTLRLNLKELEKQFKRT